MNLNKFKFAISFVSLTVPHAVMADIFIANPFWKPHCFKVESATTVKDGANVLLGIYGEKAKIVKELKISSDGKNEIYMDLFSNDGPVPVVIMDVTKNKCEKWIASVQRQMK